MFSRLGSLFYPLILSGLLFLSGCSPSPPPRWHTFNERAMGTTLHLSLEHTNFATAQQLFRKLFQQIKEAEGRLSAFDPESELSRLNRTAHKEPIPLSPKTYRAIEQALFFSDLTQGAFDITFASVGHLYEWRKGVRPDADTLSQHLPAINYRNVLLDPLHLTVHFSVEGTQIDLGGVAKGAVIDETIEWLQAQGVKRAVLNLGGDTRVLGDHNGKLWRFGIRHPRQPNQVMTTLELNGGAISTSGDYVRYFDEGEERYHHILNPEDGKPARSLQSVTITGPEAALTDALSTAVFVLGVNKGIDLINALEGVEGVLVDQTGTLHYSKGLGSEGFDR
jgi:thiamine biosynthesis lipoprotein